MKKRTVLILLLCLFLGLCTACDFENTQGGEIKPVEKKEEENKDNTPAPEVNKTTDYFCDNEKIKISTPNTWVNYTGERMNKDSNLELKGDDDSKYLLIISEEKNKFSSYTAWFDVVYGTAKNSYGLDDNELTRSDEGGLNTRFIEKDFETNGQKFYIQLYFMETNNYYNQVLIWSSFKDKELYSSEFRDIAYSLREVE